MAGSPKIVVTTMPGPSKMVVGLEAKGEMENTSKLMVVMIESPSKLLVAMQEQENMAGSPKNVVATYMKNIIDFVLGSVCTLVVGYSIAYSQRPLVDEIVDAALGCCQLIADADHVKIVDDAMRCC